VLSLAIGSEVTKEDQIPSLPLGIGATVLTGVAGPVTAIGAASARKTGDVKGSSGLRITGWIAYGLTMADAMILIGMGLSEVEPADGLIVSVGLLGAASLSCFAADAFQSAAEANAKRAGAPAADLTLAPAVSLVRTSGGVLTPTLGLRGGFL
jgi:hypothetical protein